MKLYTVNDKEFLKYGRVLSLDTKEITNVANEIKMPDSDSKYIPSLDEFEKLDIKNTLRNEIFGEMDIQIGYCYGHSSKMNALEWHKSSEINIAVTDMILFLGNVWEMEADRYNSENIKAFLLKQGEVIEVYATTMHFCPCETSKDGFGCIVALPKGTNTELSATPNDKKLFKKNKWIIAHEDNNALISRGVVGGIYGKNFEVGKDL